MDNSVTDDGVSTIKDLPNIGQDPPHIEEPINSPAGISTGESSSTGTDCRLTGINEESNLPATLEPSAGESANALSSREVLPVSASVPFVEPFTARETNNPSGPDLPASAETVLREGHSNQEVDHAPQQPSQEPRSALGFGLGAWKKASGTASSFLSSAKESSLKSAVAIGKATFSDLLQSLDNGDSGAGDASSQEGSDHGKAQSSSLESLKHMSDPSSDPRMNAEQGLSDEETRRLEVFARLHQQIEQLESERERLKQNEAKLKREGERWKKLAEERRVLLSDLKAEAEETVNQARESVRSELQSEFIQAMTENEKRISDLKIVLKQREKRLEELELECERRGATVDERQEAHEQLHSELEAQRQVALRLREDLETAARGHKQNVESLQAKYDQAVAELEIAKNMNKEAGELRQQGNHATAALEAENRQLQAQLSAMRTRWSALNILESNVEQVSQTLLSSSELKALEACKTSNDVLTLFKQSQLLITQLERRVSVSVQTAESLQGEVVLLRQANEAYQAEIGTLKEQIASSACRNGTSDFAGLGQPHVEADPSVTAVLEARLAAKTERVEALVCEVAQLRAQLQAQPDQKKSSYIGDGFSFLDDGRDSLLWIILFVPIIRLISKARGPNLAHRAENKLRKISNRIARHPTVLFVDHKLRLAVNVVSRSRSTRFAGLLYLVTVHVVLFLSLLVYSADSNGVVKDA